MPEVQITEGTVYLFLALFAAIGGFWWRIEARLKKQDTDREQLKEELTDYKLYVERNHVSASVLKEMEARLVKAMDNLASRLERIAVGWEREHVKESRENPNA